MTHAHVSGGGSQSELTQAPTGAGELPAAAPVEPAADVSVDHASDKQRRWLTQTKGRPCLFDRAGLTPEQMRAAVYAASGIEDILTKQAASKLITATKDGTADDAHRNVLELIRAAGISLPSDVPYDDYPEFP